VVDEQCEAVWAILLCKIEGWVGTRYEHKGSTLCTRCCSFAQALRLAARLGVVAQRWDPWFVCWPSATCARALHQPGAQPAPCHRSCLFDELEHATASAAKPCAGYAPRPPQNALFNLAFSAAADAYHMEVEATSIHQAGLLCDVGFSAQQHQSYSECRSLCLSACLACRTLAAGFAV
jgi:hypothetical protein